MKKKLFLALLATLLLLLAASTALAASPSDYTCTECGNPCDEWFPVSDGVSKYHAPNCSSCNIAVFDVLELCTPADGTATCTQPPQCSVCSSRIGTGYAPDPDVHLMGDWSYYDNTQHFRVCVYGCGKEQYAPHTGGTATCYERPRCTDCDSVYGELSTEHNNYIPWGYYTDTQHMRYCMDCGGGTEYGDHAGGTATCAVKAICEVCVVGYGELSTEHQWCEWIWLNDGEHYRSCTVDGCLTIEYGDHAGGDGSCTFTCEFCGETCFDETPTKHTTMSNWLYLDGTQHYRYCLGCGDYNEYGSHTGGDGSCIPTCEDCSYQYLDVNGQHNNMFDWQPYGDTQHYRFCEDCGSPESIEYSNHTGGTATCAYGPICEVCEEEYGEPLSTHNGPFWEWTNATIDQHWRKCKTCEEYEYADHTGGTATCAAAAVCDVCHENYGFRSSTHTGNLSYEYLSVDHHYKTCDVCNRTYAEKHTGGTAACESGPICELCETAYGTSLGGHDWGEWKPNGNGTHTRVCANDVIHTETDDCTGGTATCTEDGVCEVCDAAYIPAIKHNYGEWESGGDGTHTRVCLNDATHTETEECSGGEATCSALAVCTVCYQEYGAIDKDNHVGLATTWNYTDDEIHAIYCSDCKGYIVQEEHSGGEASCTEDAVCEECGTVYSAAGEHRAVTPWTFYSLAMHVRRCVDCNEIAHSGFHTGGEATCNEKAVCTLCGHTYGEVSDAHAYGEWAPVGGGLHENSCSQCQETGTTNCTLWGFLKDDTEMQVCPVCGDFAAGPFQVLLSRQDEALPGATLLVRGLEAPADGVLYAFTAAGVSGGQVVPFQKEVTISLLMSLEGFTLMRVDLKDGQETRTEIPCTPENGTLTFTIRTEGLFLLVPAA